jgi:EpsI family protein
LLLCLVGSYRVLVTPGEGARSELAALPMELLDCQGEDIAVEEAVVDDLGSDDLLVRRYDRPDGVPVWVVLIYFVNSRLGGHDPKICYISQGFRIHDLPPLEIRSAGGTWEAERFRAQRQERSELVTTYWYTPGKRLLSDVRRYRTELLLQGLRENRSYGLFIRVSTLDNESATAAERWNERFVIELANHLPSLIHE